VSNEEREQMIEYLSGPESPIGASRHDAELRLVDDDLWAYVLPEHRFGVQFEGEEGVRQFEAAYAYYGAEMQKMVNLQECGIVNEAVLQVALLAEGVAYEALQRARERFQG
jgi:hypothetical protein